MNRIQSTVSGGFDAIGGQDILDAIQGLMRSHEELSRGAGETGWRFSLFRMSATTRLLGLPQGVFAPLVTPSGHSSKTTTQPMCLRKP